MCAVTYRIQVTARNINFKSCSARMRGAVTRANKSEKWSPSFVLARRLGIESSALGRLTGSCRVTVGDKSFDVGLSLRHGTDLCVPELACPSPEGSCAYRYEPVFACISAMYPVPVGALTVAVGCFRGTCSLDSHGLKSDMYCMCPLVATRLCFSRVARRCSGNQIHMQHAVCRQGVAVQCSGRAADGRVPAEVPVGCELVHAEQQCHADAL